MEFKVSDNRNSNDIVKHNDIIKLKDGRYYIAKLYNRAERMMFFQLGRDGNIWDSNGVGTCSKTVDKEYVVKHFNGNDLEVISGENVTITVEIKGV